MIDSSVFVLFSLTFVYFATVVQSDSSCCGNTNCFESCPWQGSCDNGQDYECMDTIAGPFKCRDDSRCRGGYDECDAEEAAYRSGHYCDGFPYYNGGYPFESFKFDVEVEDYTCEIPSANNKYCSQWLTLEHSTQEFESGNATCTAESANGNYCQSWYISQLDFKRCWKEVDLGNTQQSIVLCCNDDDNQKHHCCENFCSPSFYNAYEPSSEYTDCYCEIPSQNGQFCQQWHCEEYENPSWTFETGREFETYTCLAYGGGGEAISSIEHSNHSYCQRWKGEVESVIQFELSRCNCTKESANGEYCKVWQCDEKGVDFWWPNTLWVLFVCLMGGLAPFIIVRWMYLDWAHCNTKASRLWEMFGRFFLVFFLWICPFTLIGVWKAGFVVILFCVAVVVLPTCAVFLICYDNLLRLEKAEMKQEAVKFNWFFNPPVKIALANAYIVPQQLPPTADVHGEHGEVVATDPDAAEEKSDIEMSAIAIERVNHLGSEQDGNPDVADADVAVGELCTPEGGFVLDYAAAISSSSSSSGSYDGHQLNLIDRILANLSLKYEHALNNNPFTNATAYYAQNRHGNNHYHRSSYSLNSSDDSSNGGW